MHSDIVTKKWRGCMSCLVAPTTWGPKQLMTGAEFQYKHSNWLSYKWHLHTLTPPIHTQTLSPAQIWPLHRLFCKHATNGGWTECTISHCIKWRQLKRRLKPSPTICCLCALPPSATWGWHSSPQLVSLGMSKHRQLWPQWGFQIQTLQNEKIN